MQIIIDISEEVRDNFIKRGMDKGVIAQAIENGIPLPKGHGRLIDASYQVSSDGRTVDSVCGYVAPTVIEADEEEK